MNHLQRYLVDEFVEDYQEGHISRRRALKLITGITGATMAAQILAACGQPPPAVTTAGAPTSAPAAPTAAAPVAPTAAAPVAPTAAAPSAPAAATIAGAAPNVAPDDPAIVAEMVQFQSDDTQLMGYLARPSAEGAFPIVLVCHENRGLTPHIEDVTRRVAKAGYIGLAVDLLSREGGTAKITDTDRIPGLLSGAPPERHVQDFQSGLAYVKQQPFANPDRVGMAGFCFGGGVTWLVAAGTPELRAAVPFYGPPVSVSEVPNIAAAVLAIYAANDNRINASIPEIEAAMQQNGKTYQKIIYPDVEHAFHNDTGQRYNAEATREAWNETLSWFARYLNT